MGVWHWCGLLSSRGESTTGGASLSWGGEVFYRANVRERLGFVLLAVCLASCTNTMVGPWSAWTWRDPGTAEEWQRFYPLASEALKACTSCSGFVSYPCVDLAGVGFRTPPRDHRATCVEAAETWRQRIKQSFFETHPNLDSTTRQYVQDDRVAPAGDADTVVEQVRQMEEEARARAAETERMEREKAAAQAAYERSPAGQRERKEKEEKERAAAGLNEARNRCLNAMVYGGEFVAELEQGTQALRNIVRARERGVEIDSDGRVTATVCDNLPKAVKRLDQFLPDLAGCDEVAHSMLREQDEVKMRADTAGLRTHALWSKEAALQTQRSLCGR